jgi:hypothetical protein
VHDPGDFLDASLEHPKGGRIGQHNPGSRGAHRCSKCIQVDVAVASHRHLARDAAAHGGCRRIGAVRRFRHDDLVACQIAPRPMIGADHRHPRKLAVRAREGAERHATHTGHGLEHFLQFVHAREKSLSVFDRRQWMPSEELGQHRCGIAGLRVVFHRARTERIEVRVDREVELR